MSSAFMITGARSKYDPFHEEPPGKAYYHPSKKKVLSKKQKQTSLQSATKEDIVPQTKADTKFLSGSHKYHGKMTTSEQDSPKAQFDESWPDTERPSTISIPSLDNSPNAPFDAGTHRTKSLLQELYHKYDMPVHDTQAHKKQQNRSDQKPEKESTLAKYVERFRHGAPTSREERKRQPSGTKDFWWIDSHSLTPTDSSTPKEEYSKNISRTSKASSALKSNTLNPPPKSKLTKENLRRRNLKENQRSILQSSKLEEESDRNLQAKADKLLEKTASTLNSSDPIVSTDGLGSSLSNNSGSAFSEVPYRPAFTKKQDESKNPYNAPNQSGEDILQQWRLRRKMELARERVQSKSTADSSSATAGKPFPQVKTSDDIESRLAAFRQRLAQSSGITQPIKSSTTSADQQKQPQTDILHTPAKVHFTQAPKLVDAEAQTSANKGMSAELGVSQLKPHECHSPVASPHLPRNRHADSIEPHHHLSCDIIPCPSHHNSHRAKFPSEVAVSHEILKPTSDPNRNDLVPERDVTYTDSEVEIKTLNEVKNTLSFDGISSSAEETDCEKLNGNKYDAHQQHSELQKIHKTRQPDKGVKQKKPVLHQKEEKKHSNHRSKDNKKVKLQKQKVLQEDDEQKIRRSRVEHSVADKDVNKLKYSQAHRQSRPQDSRKSPKLSVRGTVGKVVSQRLFASTSQSVNSELISSTESVHINRQDQTLQESRDLSDITSVSLLSSVECPTPNVKEPDIQKNVSRKGHRPNKPLSVLPEEFSSSTSLTKHEDNKVEPKKCDIVLQSIQDLELAVASDEEDFMEDEILMELRRKRSQYLKRLEEIEDLINCAS